MTRGRKIAAGALLLVAAGGIATALLVRPMRRKPVVLEGVVIRQAADPRGQAPIAGVEVSATGGLASAITRTTSSGLFRLVLRPGIGRGRAITLLFSRQGYEPLSLPTYVGDQLYVVRLASTRIEPEAGAVPPSVVVSDVLVRYSVQNATTETVGTGAKTFQVVNTPNVPCDNRSPCSPDGRWKAAERVASLDAGKGNLIQNPRVSCIAGPCPFTSTEMEADPQGGQVVKVTAVTWSATATFLLQAEVVHPGVTDTVHESYPVIFGRAMNFSLPATAEGPSLEATLNGVPIIFPLPPHPDLGWADCTVSVEKGRTKLYRCELKPKYKF